jgi:O-antigen ligase
MIAVDCLPSSHRSANSVNPCALLLRRAFDGLTLLLLVVAPLFMGGRQPLGRLIYVVLVGAMALVWLTERCLRGNATYQRCRLEIPIVCALALVGFQCLPVGPEIVQRVSPRLTHYLVMGQLSNDDAMLPTWSTVSLTPHVTRSAWIMLCAHATLLVLFLQRLQTIADIRRLLRMVAIAGIVVATVGWLQYLFGNGKFLWVYENPFRDTSRVIRGPFYNENHFAHFVALTLGPIWLWLYEQRQRRTGQHRAWRQRSSNLQDMAGPLLCLALITATLAALLTQSRGGMIMVALSLSVVGWGLWRSERFDWRRVSRWGLVLAGALIPLALHGHESVRREAATLTSGSLESIDQHGGRRGLWHAGCQLAREFPIFGAGVGSFRDAYPLFHSEQSHVDYSYAESGFLQIAAETGGMGVLILITFISQGWGLLQPLTRRSIASTVPAGWIAVVAAGLAVSGLHSLFDFVWFIPACFAITLALLAAGFAMARIALSESTNPTHWRPLVIASRRQWIVTWCVAAILLLISLRQLTNSVRGAKWWNGYLLIAAQSQEATSIASITVPRMDDLRRMHEQLMMAVRFDPCHSRAHLRLAANCLRLFELMQRDSDNPMSLAQIRDAAIASEFPSRAAQDLWLKQAIGDHRTLLDQALWHAWRAMRLAPLQGQAYVHLAELEFLWKPNVNRQQNYMEQALRVRPNDGLVLFAAGQSAVLAGDLPSGLKLWRKAYQQHGSLRQEITRLLALQLPAESFVSFFRPDLSTLFELNQFYKQAGAIEPARYIANSYLDQLTSTSSARAMQTAQDWQRGYSLASELGDSRSLKIARQAVSLDPNNYAMRRRFALELIACGQLSQATEMLEWCVQRDPLDRTAAKKLDQVRQRLAQR